MVRGLTFLSWEASLGLRRWWPEMGAGDGTGLSAARFVGETGQAGKCGPEGFTWWSLSFRRPLGMLVGMMSRVPLTAAVFSQWPGADIGLAYTGLTCLDRVASGALQEWGLWPNSLILMQHNLSILSVCLCVCANLLCPVHYSPTPISS